MKIKASLVLLLPLLFSSARVDGQSDEMERVKTEITQILLIKKGARIIESRGDKVIRAEYPTGILVQDDKIDFKFKDENVTVSFSAILDYKIEAVWVHGKNSDGPETGELIFGPMTIYMRWLNIVALAKDLNYIQNKLNEKRFNELKLFEPEAAQYRALKVKPPVTEEQRKYIVQANLLNQQKRYREAIELYNKALETDQTAYPAGYSNLALLCAQLEKYDVAIYYMKKYLLLEPEASDARSAQDKIYEWEMMMK
jgi:tetratricopeptide (TPR) repeat protein